MERRRRTIEASKVRGISDDNRNEKTGLRSFEESVLPLTLSAIDLQYSGAIVCAVATFAAIQEGHLIRKGDQHGNKNTEMENRR